MRRRGWILAGAIGLTAAGAPAATASTPRYASVAGSGTACTATAPCSLEAAISGTGGNPTHAHDEVVIEPGTYGTATSPAPLVAPAGIPLTIHGVAGQPRPVIRSDTTSAAITIADPGTTLTHVEVDEVAPAGGTAIRIDAGAASDVVANAYATSGVACSVLGTLQESVCFAAGASGAAVEAHVTSGEATPRLRGVTGWASGSGSTGLRVLAEPGTAIVIGVTNTIAHGMTSDIDMRGDGVATSRITIDHSAYAALRSSGARVSGSGVGAAQLVDPEHGNFRELPTSPTVDAGAADPPATDIYGVPRTLGSAPDIGAAELVKAPSVAATGATAVTDRTATLTGIVNPQGTEATYQFAYGTTPGTGSHTGKASAGAVAAGHAVTAKISGLRAGTTYFVRLSATNAGGTTISPLAQFTTLPSFKGLTIRSRRARADSRHRVKIAVACPKDTPKRCTGTLTLSHAGHARFNVKAGKKGRVTITLGMRARAALTKHARVKVRATAKAKDGAGRKKTTKRTVTLLR